MDNCNHKKVLNKQYDAFYCELCNKWLEKKCDDPNCEFCKQRPDKPPKEEEK